MKMRSIVCLGLALFLSAAMAAPGNRPDGSLGHTDRPTVGRSTAAVARLNVVVDPRMELLSTVQLLSGYNILNQLDFPYKQAVLKSFTPFRDHPAVACFAELSAKGFAFGAPVEMILCLSAPPELLPVRPFTEFALRRAGGQGNIERFVSLLRQFAADSDFAAFFAAHRDAYADMVAMVRSRFQNTDDVGLLEAYYGIRQHSYTFVFAPLIHGGGFGVRFDSADKTFDIYSVCGPREVLNGQPQVRPAEEFRYLLWHEFSHSFVNPVSAGLAGRFAPYAGLIEVIKQRGYLKGREKELEGVPADLIWGECIDEHIVRAVTARLAFREYGPEARDRRLQAEVANGFIFTPAIATCLEDYEAHRDRYRTIVDYFGRIADAFGRIASLEEVPLAGKQPDSHEEREHE